MSRETTHTLASWNVEHGGYADYEITGTPPKKTSRIAETVQNLDLIDKIRVKQPPSVSKAAVYS